MRSLLFVLFGFISLSALAAGETLSLEGFETTQKTKKIVRFEELSAIQSKAQSFFDSEQCADAIPLLEKVSAVSNDIANTITSGLDPFYDASRDESREFMSNNRDLFKKLVEDEANANSLKKKRNLAMVMIGECHIKLGETSQGLSFLRKALDLIDVEDLELWGRARSAAYDVVGYSSGQKLTD